MHIDLLKRVRGIVGISILISLLLVETWFPFLPLFQDQRERLFHGIYNIAFALANAFFGELRICSGNF